MFERHLALSRNRPVAEVTRADVERLHRDVSKPIIVENSKTKQRRQLQDPVAANRLLALISGIFTKARNWAIFHGDNPARGVQKIPEHSRTRLLYRHGELARFRAALDVERD